MNLRLQTIAIAVVLNLLLSSSLQDAANPLDTAVTNKQNKECTENNCKRCAENSIIDPVNNQPCLVNLENLKNEAGYSIPSFHAIPGQPMALECPITNLEYITETDWYRNEKGVPSKCKMNSTSKNSDKGSWLYCPNMTIEDEGLYTCREHEDLSNYHHHDVLVFVKNESHFEQDSCYCSGISANCSQNANVTTDIKSVKMFSLSLSPIIFRTAQDNFKTTILKYTILEGRNPSTIVQWQNDGPVFYALSSQITDRKLELYQGSLLYEVSLRRGSTVTNHFNPPFALMRGDGKTLVYYEFKNYNSQSRYRKISFSKHNWHMVQENSVTEENASEADVIKVLSNLEGIYVSLDYDVSDFALNTYKLDLTIVEFKNHGLKIRPSSIGKCSYPTEGADNDCKECPVNYSENTTNPTNNSTSVSNLAQFSSKKFDCLILYICSLCWSILWHRFI